MAVLTGTTAKRNAWIEWLNHCRGGRFANPLFFDKTIGGVPDVWVDAIVALERAHRAGGYTPKSAWAYNFRGIGGATCTCSSYSRCSLHSNGIAIDIDPGLNPFIKTSTFRWSDTAYTPEQVALIEGIRNTKGEPLWDWGGRWNSVKDYMHWEANVDPGSTAVDWATVPGEGEQGDEDMKYADIYTRWTAADIQLMYDRGQFQASSAAYYINDIGTYSHVEDWETMTAACLASGVALPTADGGGGDLSRGDSVVLT